MKHLGDITKLNGGKIPFVDVITGGSPCQDLSIAGKRAGLAGERSGLFMEQIRVIKEMREASGTTYPRYMVWENVPGAFSSNKGKDFAAVLEETIRIVEPEAPGIEVPTKGWPARGCYRNMDGRWSVAWRTLDAQYWGVPQRRRRIALVADFGGCTAPEILFERKSMSGNFEASGEARKGTAKGTERSIGETGVSVKNEFRGINGEICGTLDASYYKGQGATLGKERDFVCRCTVDAFSAGQGEKAGGIGYQEQVAPTMKAGSGLNDVPTICIQGNCVDRTDTAGCNRKGWKEDVSYTLNTVDRHCVAVLPFDTTQITSPKNGNKPKYGDPCHPICAGAHAPAIAATMLFENHSQDCRYKGPLEVCPMLPAQLGTGGNNTPFVVQAYSFDSLASNGVKSKNPHSGCKPVNVAKTLDTTYPDPSKNQGGIAIVQSYQEKTGTLSPGAHAGSYNGQDAYNDMLVARTLLAKGNDSFRYDTDTYPIQEGFVRRLTPLECERLQGYPDGWTDIGEWIDSKGKKHKEADSPRYKALGNSIALPPWKFVLSGIYANLPDGATLGSLFDGIGGFPLIWKDLGGIPVWASEIESFPIAVTKTRFGDT